LTLGVKMQKTGKNGKKIQAVYLYKQKIPVFKKNDFTEITLYLCLIINEIQEKKKLIFKFHPIANFRPTKSKKGHFR